MKHKIFKNLFVLEIANNHWGDVERGLRLIREYGNVVKKNGMHAAVKFQLRDVESFIHKDYLPQEVSKKDKELTQAPGTNIRYIKKTLSTKLSKNDFVTLVKEVKSFGMVTMATPFDEASVDFCEELDLQIIKISSQDATAWTLLEKIASVKRPTVISNGGTEYADLDKVVKYFEEQQVPLAINHCISLYPTEDNELQLNQLDILKKRYPNNLIGLSSHEYHDWTISLVVAYAKGAETFERHVDIEADGIPVSKYCSLPYQIDDWFKVFNKAKEMMGENVDSDSNNVSKMVSEKEKQYVRSVSRGAYALKDLPTGYTISKEGIGKDFLLAIPLQEGQISSRDLDSDIVLLSDVKEKFPIFKNN